MYSRSAYGSDKKNVSETKDDIYKHPVVYTIRIKDGIVLLYSNTRDNGHFGIPKLILKRGSVYSILDIKGEYGMTQFASAIVDTPENLIKIKEAIESRKFKKARAHFAGTGGSTDNSIIDGLGTTFKFISMFKKIFGKNLYKEKKWKRMKKK